MLVDFSTIGSAIREARVGKQLSQMELAQKLGVTQGTISRAEAGRDLRVGTLVEIARALDLEPILAPRRLVPAIQAILSSNNDRQSAVYTSDDGEPYHEGPDDAAGDSHIGSPRRNIASISGTIKGRRNRTITLGSRS
jgi:HTH-type transcriptional regulator/antitoxin HipB